MQFPTTARSRGTDVRVMFWVLLAFIAAGLCFQSAMGLLQR
jgi:hypothetical protein